MQYTPLPRKKVYAKKGNTISQTQAVKREVDRVLAKSKDYKQCWYDSTTTVSYSGTNFPLLSNMSRGDSAQNNFEGAKVMVKNIHIRGQVSAADISNCFRLILFQWDDSTIPVPSDVLYSPIVGTTAAPWAFRSWSAKPLYKILRDETIQLTANANANGGPGPVVSFDMFVKGSKIQPTFFQSTTATVFKGGLYLLAVSDSAAATHPTLVFTCEMIFTDE